MASATSSAPEFEAERAESADEAGLEEDCFETVYQRQAK
jgi:hypothetical protein